jgi:hypothetical protein
MYGIAKGGAQRLRPVFTGIGVLNFKFQFVLFHRTDVQRGYVTTTTFTRVLMDIVRPLPPGTYMYTQLI